MATTRQGGQQPANRSQQGIHCRILNAQQTHRRSPGDEQHQRLTICKVEAQLAALLQIRGNY